MQVRSHQERDELECKRRNGRIEARHRVGKQFDGRDAEGCEFEHEQGQDDGTTPSAIGRDEDVGIGQGVTVLSHHGGEHLGRVWVFREEVSQGSVQLPRRAAGEAYSW